MTAHAYVMAAAILLVASLGGPRDLSPSADTTLLIATDRVLADVEQFRIFLMIQDGAQGEKLVDLPKLRAQIATKLDEAGIKHSDDEAGMYPRLVVQIEGMPLPECKQYVCRVQTSMSRIVTCPGPRELQIEAEVWRLRPMMKVAAPSDVGKAITDVALMQIEGFIGTYKAARKLQDRAKSVEPNVPGSEDIGRSKPSSQNPVAVSRFPFVASRSGLVFHRPECRWAQNISAEFVSSFIGKGGKELAYEIAGTSEKFYTVKACLPRP